MEFKWMNESKLTKTGDKIVMYAPEHTDFFNGGTATSVEGELPANLCNAPYYYTEVTGDFVLRVKVSHGFRDTYDSASVMVMQDMEHWAKACFELTDFGTHAAVSVVTKGDSDDANGCNIEGDTAWLQVCRVGNSFAFHYSVDGETFYMTRFFNLDCGNTVRVGLLAQAPTGSGDRVYEHLRIKNRTVGNIRAGK